MGEQGLIACDHGRRPEQMLSTEYCAGAGTMFHVKATTATSILHKEQNKQLPEYHVVLFSLHVDNCTYSDFPCM